MSTKRKRNLSSENIQSSEEKRKTDESRSTRSNCVVSGPSQLIEAEETLRDILKVLVCPVCLDRLSSKIVSCVNGHAICARCKRNMTKCPLCRKRFLDEKPTILSQVLKAFANPCRNVGCQVVEKNIEAHERLCSFRAVQCKICLFQGYLSDLMEHVQSSHSLATTSVNRSFKNFVLDADYHWVSGCIYDDEFFWRKIETNLINSRLSFYFLWVPKRDKEESFQITVEFLSDRVEYVGKMTISCSDTNFTSKNCLSFDTSMLKDFIDEEGTLKYNIHVIKNPSPK